MNLVLIKSLEEVIVNSTLRKRRRENFRTEDGVRARQMCVVSKYIYKQIKISKFVFKGIK